VPCYSVVMVESNSQSKLPSSLIDPGLTVSTKRGRVLYEADSDRWYWLRRLGRTGQRTQFPISFGIPCRCGQPFRQRCKPTRDCGRACLCSFHSQMRVEIERSGLTLSQNEAMDAVGSATGTSGMINSVSADCVVRHRPWSAQLCQGNVLNVSLSCSRLMCRRPT